MPHFWFGDAGDKPFECCVLVIAGLLRTNRVLIEEPLERVKTLQYANLLTEPDLPITMPSEALYGRLGVTAHLGSLSDPKEREESL